MAYSYRKAGSSILLYTLYISMTDCQIVRRSSKILFVCMQASLSIFFTINQRSPSMINIHTFIFRREGSTPLLLAFLSGWFWAIDFVKIYPFHAHRKKESSPVAIESGVTDFPFPMFQKTVIIAFDSMTCTAVQSPSAFSLSGKPLDIVRKGNGIYQKFLVFHESGTLYFDKNTSCCT